MEERVILVNTDDVEIGTEEKMRAHEQGLLHRAFSIFIYNKKGEMLLQKRAKSKYHSGGLWTNACCSHPRKGETVEQAAHRRLQEEFGFDCTLKNAFSFIYEANLDHGLKEHEYDYVLIGTYDGPFDNINPEEIEDFRFITQEKLLDEVMRNPNDFTVWFRIALERL
jgi:isopentenyl-diphosphate Delta-isomerase